MRCVRPGRIDGACVAPPSKSALQRAIAVATLAAGRSRIAFSGLCDDAAAALRAARALGAGVVENDGGVEIAGGGRPTGEPLDCGESGLSLRLFTAVSALFDTELELLARGTLVRRSAAMVEAPLRALGARCSTSGGFPPIRVRGPIRGGEVAVDGRDSSQLLTGLLIALPLCREDSVVSCPGLASKPYVAMTMETLARFGVRVEADAALERFHIRGGQRLAPAELRMEGDWSGAAFMLVAGAIAGAVAVTGLDLESRQADRAVLDALRAAGAHCRAASDAVRVERGELRAFEFDAGHCPDLFPPLAVLAAYCEGESVLHGAARLVGKESDRRAVLVDELGGLGLAIRADGDVMRIRGGALRGGRVDSRGDHRIAMAAAVAALGAAAPLQIEGEACVSKSYPRFFADLGGMGVCVS